MASPPGTMVHNISRSRQFAPSESQRETQRETRRTTSKPLNFSTAMNDFSVMFPELDRDVIETVLRANNGVVQSTIDQLLVLQDSTIEECKHNEPNLPSYENSIGGDEEPPPAYNDIWHDVQAPNQNSGSIPKYGNLAATNTGGGHFWNAPLVGKLPDDFLRLNVHVNSTTTTNSNNINNNNRNKTSTEEFMSEEDIERFLEDEKLALFLQNEEFLRELRRNPEFVTSLEADHRRAVQASGDSPSAPTENVASGGARPRTQATSTDDAAFKHKLKHMGKSTRKKFGKMAKKFSRAKGSTKLPVIMHGGESTFNLLEEEEDDEKENRLGLDGIQEDLTNNDYDGDIETEEEKEREKRIRTSAGNGRQLPQPPGSQSSGTDEPIVFYSEDNEFAYKID